MKNMKNVVIIALIVVVVILSVCLYFSLQHQKTIASVYRIVGGLDSQISKNLSDLEKVDIAAELISNGITRIEKIDAIELPYILLASDQHIVAYRIESFSGNSCNLYLEWIGEGYNGFSIDESINTPQVGINTENVESSPTDLENVEIPPPNIIPPESIIVINPKENMTKKPLQIESENIAFFSYGYQNEAERPVGQLTFAEVKNLLVSDDINPDFKLEIHELTNAELWELTGVQVYNVGEHGGMYAGWVVKDGEVFANIADGFAGSGLQGLGVKDMNNDGIQDIIYRNTWGSGIIRTDTNWLDLSSGEINFIESDFDEFLAYSAPKE